MIREAPYYVSGVNSLRESCMMVVSDLIKRENQHYPTVMGMGVLPEELAAPIVRDRSLRSYLVDRPRLEAYYTGHSTQLLVPARDSRGGRTVRLRKYELLVTHAPDRAIVKQSLPYVTSWIELPYTLYRYAQTFAPMSFEAHVWLDASREDSVALRLQLSPSPLTRPVQPRWRPPGIANWIRNNSYYVRMPEPGDHSNDEDSLEGGSTSDGNSDQ